MKAIAALALLVLACGSTPPPPPAPTTWTSLPPTIVQALCTKLHAEGMGGTINIVTTTAPLITRESLIGLAAAADAPSKKDQSKLNDVLAVASLKLPIALEGTGACELHPIASAAAGHSDEMLLELSAPFVNPFERKSTGLLARLSLAGEAPQWYWIPLGLHNGQWMPSLPMALAVPHD